MPDKEVLQDLIQNFSTENLNQLFRNKSNKFRLIKENENQLNNEFFSKALRFGEINLANDDELIIYTFNTTKDLTERSGKKAQYELAKKILRQEQRYSAGFFIFYDVNSNFRLSLVYDTPLPNGKREWSNFKRFTYYVNKDQTNKTFIYRLEAADFSSLEKIKEAFSVDKVTKEFYTEIANWYFWAIDNVEFPDDEDIDREQRNAKNLIRLITRIIFIWFMKEKKLVSQSLFEKEYIDRILQYEDKTGSTYYKAIMQNLFFATLNTSMKKDDSRSRIFIEEAQKGGFINEGFLQQGYYRYSRFIKDKKLFLNLFENIPFLNGGLFECLDKIKDGREIRIDCFSNNTKNEKRLKVPDELFFLENERTVDLSKHLGDGINKKVRGLLTILKGYNFTIDENTPVDEEVALDPELLGKVFENLLASYNPETATIARRKSTGSYYTPREIVEFMVNESLVEYLKNKLNSVSLVIEDNIRSLFDYNKDENPFNSDAETTLKIIDAIENVKILDPACGSGAFPMGILHKLALALHKLDPVNNIWKKRLLDRVPTEIRDETERSLQNKSLDYIRKLGLIEHCIYGVDIQEIAIQISKLRFFISLLVEQQIDDSSPNRDVRSLPNLETKFVAANALVKLEKPTQLSMKGNNADEIESQLFGVREEIFYTNSRSEKLKLQKKEKLLREKLKDALTSSGFITSTAIKIANWDPFDQNTHADWFDQEWMFGPEVKYGFDIVIANPPYITIRNQDNKLKSYIKSNYKYSKNADIYLAFLEAGLNILKRKGNIIFIIPNKFFGADYGKEFRSFLKKGNVEINLIWDLKDEKVFDALISTVVFSVLNSPKQNPAKLIQSNQILLRENLFDEVGKIQIEASSGDSNILTRIYLNKKLSDFAYVRTGIMGFEYWEMRNIIKSNRSVTDNYRPIYTNGNFKRYENNWQNEIIRLYKEDYIAPTIELSNKYLNSNTIELFRTFPKILVRGVSKNVSAIIDEIGSGLLVAVHSVIPFNVTNLKWLLAILNSRFINWFHLKTIYSIRIPQGSLKYPVSFFENIPIAEPLNKKYFTECVDKILSSKKNNPKSDTKHFEDQIDVMVYKLYNLTYEEVKIIEPEIEKIISEKDYEKLEKVS